MNGGQRVAEVLARSGVPFLFTLCGGHISPILVACRRRGVRVVDVRHEATAVFAADAVARLTGIPGVAAVTAGPGVTNSITALENARLAQSPVVVLGGATATILKGRGSLQDIDQMVLLKPVVKWATSVATLSELVPALEHALAESVADTPGPVLVEMPLDLLYDADLVRSWYLGKSAPGNDASLAARAQHWVVRRHLHKLFQEKDPVVFHRGYLGRTHGPANGKVERAAGLLEAAQRPVLLVGSQAVSSPATARSVAAAVERLGVPVYLSGMARGLLGPDAPLQFVHRRSQALKEADLVLLAGVPLDFRLDYGRQIGHGAKLVSANLSLEDLTRNRLPDVASHGDPAWFLTALSAHLPGPVPRPEWFARLRARETDRAAEITRQAGVKYPRVNPLALAGAIDERLSDRSMVIADGGDFVATCAYVVRPRGPLAWLDPGVFGTLGVGAGFALGARLVHPESDVWLLYGDGAAGYSLMEFDTFVRHEIPILAVVGNDAGWAQIARDQVELLHDPVGTELADTDYHRLAASLGARGFDVAGDADVPAALDAALTAVRAGHPALVNARIARTDFRKGSISM